MATLCFGGSFNPIHHGHLICARAAAEARGFDRVLLIPSAQPPHKYETAMAAPDHRLKMCHLAVAGSTLFEVSDLELTRSGPSFTIDTALELQRRGAGPVHWLIGADMLLSLPTWHRPQELLKAVNFIILARPGWSLDWSHLPPEYRNLQQNVVEAPLIDIRATHIRSRVQAGLPIDYLTPRAVCDYITAQGLYR